MPSPFGDFWIRDEFDGMRPSNDPSCRLSVRESEIVDLVAQGLENKEIAGQIFVSVHTVRNHLRSIFNKLGLTDRLEIALWRVASPEEIRRIAGPERRQKRRFQIFSSIRYSAYGAQPPKVSGAGKVINMSMTGALLRTEEQLERGLALQVSMDWPVKLDNVRPLQLVLTGPIIRTHQNEAVLSIARIQFRTRPNPTPDQRRRFSPAEF